MNPKVDKSSARQAAYQAIVRVEKDHAFTDIVLEHVLRNRIDKRDNALISEMVRGTIRWKKQLAWVVNSFLQRPQDIPAYVHWLLWLGAFQILHMNIPDFAAVNETVEITKKQFRKWTKLVNGVLRSIIRNRHDIEFPDADKDPIAYIAVSQSHPEWMVERWIQQFGYETTLALCTANNQAPAVTVRMNPMRTNAKSFEKMLQEQNFQYTNGTIDGFYRLHDMNVPSFQKWIAKGLISVQDESAGLVAQLCSPQPHDVIFDLCSAPGGKSAHLAELTRDQCTILAGEINPSRAGLTAGTAKRLGLHSIHALSADGLHFPGNKADLVLLDAPCSGLGVLRKKPDMRWNRTLHDFKSLPTLQMQLLQGAAQLVVHGGHLIYSTCTIERSENEDIVETFLHKNKQFTIVDHIENDFYKNFNIGKGYVHTWPHIHNMDGSFMVKLKRK